MTDPLPPHAAPAADPAAMLAERARQLARPAAPLAVAGAEGEALHFRVARERFAVAARDVLAAFRLRSLTPLPGATPPVVGLTGWRGLVLTLVDLRGPAGASTAGLDDLGHVVVLGGDRPVAGVLADAVLGTQPLAEGDVLPLPAARADAARVLRGVTRDATLVLDAPRLLALLEGAPDATPETRLDARPAAAGAPLPPLRP